MNGRNHDVRGRVLRELKKEFAEVGFQDRDARALEHVVEADFFGHHGLRLHDLLRILRLDDGENVVGRLFLRARKEDVSAPLVDFFRELVEVGVEVFENVLADLLRTRSPAFPVAEVVDHLLSVPADQVLGLGDGRAHDLVVRLAVKALVKREAVRDDAVVGVRNVDDEGALVNFVVSFSGIHFGTHLGKVWDQRDMSTSAMCMTRMGSFSRAMRPPMLRRQLESAPIT